MFLKRNKMFQLYQSSGKTHFLNKNSNEIFENFQQKNLIPMKMVLSI